QEKARAIFDALPDRGGHVPGIVVNYLQPSSEPPIAVPSVPSVRGLQIAVDMTIAKLLREKNIRGSEASLAVQCRFVAAGQGNVGLLLDVDDEEGISSSVIWYQATDDRAFTSPALVSEQAWPQLVEAAVSAADEVRGA